MTHYLVYIPRELKPGEAEGDQFVVLKVNMPKVDYDRAELAQSVVRIEGKRAEGVNLTDPNGRFDFTVVVAKDRDQAIDLAIIDGVEYLAPDKAAAKIASKPTRLIPRMETKMQHDVAAEGELSDAEVDALLRATGGAASPDFMTAFERNFGAKPKFRS